MPKRSTPSSGKAAKPPSPRKPKKLPLPTILFSETATEITADELRSWLERGKPVTVLDIRSRDEVSDWSIPDSIRFDNAEEKDMATLDSLAASKDHPVIVLGSSARMIEALDRLRAAGFQAAALAGGMKAWSPAWNRAEVPFTDGDVRVVQFRRTGKGCLSYLVASDRLAVIIDASLDPEIYIKAARELGVSIMAVLDTHIHSDHISRSRLLSSKTGAAIGLPETSRASYPYDALRDSDGIRVGRVMLTAMRTPGHSPESVTYRLDNRALFTGDTLLSGGMGRPDVEPDAKGIPAASRALFRSLTHLLTLPGEFIVLPGHSSEPVPFDGLPIAASLLSLQEGIRKHCADEATFLSYVRSHIPPCGSNHQKITKLNEKGLFPEGDVLDIEVGGSRWMLI